MRVLLLYLFQVLISSGIFYGYYHLFLRNKKFHQYNRYFLLLATIISICIPFLDIPVYFDSEEAKPIFLQSLTVFSSEGSEENIIATSSSLQATSFAWKNILSSLYLLIACFFFIRFIAALLRIARLVQIYPGEKIDNIQFINTSDPATPFSFFRWLFWNNKIELNSANGQQIFRHELFHIRQKHSWDIVFLEIITMIFWVNPFFHLIKKEIKAIHEFLADQFAVNENHEWDYAELLLMQVLDSPNIRLTNPFFHNQIKRRIAMLTTSKKPGYQYLRKIMVLPLVAITIGMFAFTYKNKVNHKAWSKEPVTIVVDAGHGGDDPGASSSILESDTIPEKSDNKIFERIEIDPSFPGGEKAWTKFLQRNINESIPAQKGAPSGKYTVFIRFIVDKDGKIRDLKPLTAHGYGMEEQALEIIRKSPRWLPGIQNGKKVNVYKKQRVDFTIANNKKNTTLIIVADTIKLNNKNTTLIFVADTVKLNTEEVVNGYTDTKPVQADEVKPVGYVANESIPKNVFSKVEIEPSFPGGDAAWRKYLERNLNPEILIRNGAPEGVMFKAMIRYIVNTDGTISDVRPLTNHGYGIEAEAIRLVKNSPEWLPAIQNGKKVNAYRKQPILFFVEKEKR